MSFRPYDPERDVPNFVKQFIISVRRRALQDETHAGTSRESRIKLIIELNERLSDKLMRVPVLQAITGLPITSQNQLTQAYTSVLIDEVINERDLNSKTIAYIEKLVKERTGIKTWELYPWDRPDIILPVLPETDTAPF